MLAIFPRGQRKQLKYTMHQGYDWVITAPCLMPRSCTQWNIKGNKSHMVKLYGTVLLSPTQEWMNQGLGSKPQEKGKYTKSQTSTLDRDFPLYSVH